jgi:hypothetical protein
VENIAGYVYDHTRCDARRWRQLGAELRGPYFVSPVNRPRREEFLKSVRLHIEKHAGCDPLDGQVHTIEEVTRWIGIRELALRFIGLGVILGVFQLEQPWLARDDEKHEDMIKRLQRENGARFRLKLPWGSLNESCNTRFDSSLRHDANCTPVIITSSAELLWAALPSSSTTSSVRHRPWSKSARRPSCADTWPSRRSSRYRRV